MPESRLDSLSLTGAEPVLPSSFAVGTAAQVSMAAAALAALEIGTLRGAAPQQVSVDMREAALECCGYFRLDDRASQGWDKIAGLYACGANGERGWVRLHTNFAHHRDGVLALLGLPTGPETQREAVAQALRAWSATDFEQAATDARLVVAAVRSFEEWDRHPHAPVIAVQPLVSIERIGDASPLDWPALPVGAQALRGLRVLDLTRILAGPVCGRTLAAYGADVMLVNSPHLPNIESIAETSRGKLSVHIDLRKARGMADLQRLVRDAHVFVQGYRPGGLDTLGFGPIALAQARPGIVCVSLSAYGDSGPWAGKRGFDSLVQTAIGLNHAEADAAGSAQPKPLPMQVLDYATGFLMAFGAQAALRRQSLEGGSWHVRVSLARTALWLRSMGRLTDGFSAPGASFEGMAEEYDSGFGKLVALRHAPKFSRTPAHWLRPSMPPGSHAPVWPANSV
jgi:crotonobetainyl-CoA:carnitine CoA-transferase CaiB-like acyl-CoA transferase